MSENIFTLAVWTRELFNNLPSDMGMNGEHLFDDFVDPNRAEIEALFSAMNQEEQEALAEKTLNALAASDIDAFAGTADEARDIVSDRPRQHLSEFAETAVVIGAAAVAMVIACRMRDFKAKADGTIETSFYEGVPKGAVQILRLLLDKMTGINRIIDRLRRGKDDSED